MGAEPWVDRERAIWNVLPLRPQPQPLEIYHQLHHTPD